jgi:hypothetical protein
MALTQHAQKELTQVGGMHLRTSGRVMWGDGGDGEV